MPTNEPEEGICMDYLEKLGITDSDIGVILEHDRRYGKGIRALAAEYMQMITDGFMKPYPKGGLETGLKRADSFLARAKALDSNGKDDYMTSLLFWLHCVPYGKEVYRKQGISEKVFYDTMADIAFKLAECKQVYGKCGVFTNWFFLIFEWKLVALGRLQYQITDFPKDHYEWNGFRLNQGDPVYACHIPSSGKLTEALCMESLQQAYDFFKKDLRTSILPVVCNSWLLFPPYVESVFPEGSNMKAFAQLFDIIDQSGDEGFYDCWRVFGRVYEGTTEGFPCDNTLRRNFIRHIENVGTFGYGYGVLLYDGEKKQIINR